MKNTLSKSVMEQSLKLTYPALYKLSFVIGVCTFVMFGMQNLKKNDVFQVNYRDFQKADRTYRNMSDSISAGKKESPSTAMIEQLEFLQTRKRDNLFNCKLLFDGDKNEVEKALTFSEHSNATPMSPGYYIKITKNCKLFKSNRFYIEDSLTEEEKNFPIAFTLMMYKDVEQSERLLRSIYRPQNYYCIHIDKNSAVEIHEAMSGIASCFPNVFISSRSIKVQWGLYSALEQDLICMEDLIRYSWRYFINLTGQEFPLKTNKELVAILKALNGSNSIAGSIEYTRPFRTDNVFDGWTPTGLKSQPPSNVTLIQGSVHITAQRGFVDFVLYNQTAIELRDWLKDTIIQDETYFTTLNYNPQRGVPGAYMGKPEMDVIDVPEGQYPRNPFIARFKNWGKREFNWPCHGKRVREICIFGIGDLPMLASRRELFANKFFSSYQPEAYYCLEELHFNKTIDQIIKNQPINVTFYEHLDFVKNHVQ